MDSAFEAFCAAAKRHSLLTAREEIELTRTYRRGLEADASKQTQRASKRAKDRLVNANLRLVITVSNKYRARIAGTGLTIEDLCQEAVLGLIRAVEKFEPERGYKFSTYAYLWIQQALGRITDTQRGLIRTPTTAVQLVRRWKYREHGQTFTDFCEQYGYKPEVVLKELEHSSRAAAVSLDQPVDGEDVTLSNLIAAPSEDVLGDIDYQEAIAHLRRCAGDDLALMELAAAGATRKELAEVVGCGANQIGHVIAKAKTKLKQATPTHVAMQLCEQSPVRLKQQSKLKSRRMELNEPPTRNGHEAPAETEPVIQEPVAAVEEAPVLQRAPRRVATAPAPAPAVASGVAPGVLRIAWGELQIEAAPADAAEFIRHLNAA